MTTKPRIGSIVRVNHYIGAREGNAGLSTDVDCLIVSGGGPRIRGRFMLHRLDKQPGFWWVDADVLTVRGWLDPTQPA